MSYPTTLDEVLALRSEIRELRAKNERLSRENKMLRAALDELHADTLIAIDRELGKQ